MNIMLLSRAPRALQMAFSGLLTTCLLAACQPGGTSNEADAQGAKAPLAGARIGADFTLTDQDGKARKWADFSGQYRLVYFGYTYCPDVCPMDLQNIMAGFRLFEKAHPQQAAKLAPMLITVDPERDTPAVLKTYVSAFHPRLIGLTGSPEAIEAVKRAFAVVAGKEGDEKATKNYLVSHTRTPFLFGPDGAPIALVPVSDGQGPGGDGSAQAVASFLAQWVK